VPLAKPLAAAAVVPSDGPSNTSAVSWFRRRLVGGHLQVIARHHVRVRSSQRLRAISCTL